MCAWGGWTREDEAEKRQARTGSAASRPSPQPAANARAREGRQSSESVMAISHPGRSSESAIRVSHPSRARQEDVPGEEVARNAALFHTRPDTAGPAVR